MSASEDYPDHEGGSSSRTEWYILVGLVFVSLGLGTHGFLHATYAGGEAMDGCDAFYNSMRLFHMHFDRPKGELPWPLQTARFLAPVLLAYSLFKGFLYAAHRQRRAFAHGHKCGHVVICGLGQKGLHLAREYQRKGRWVVVVERHPQNEFLTLCAEERIHCILGDATEPSVLREARVAQAAEVIVVTADDETNLRIAVQVGELTQGAGRGGAAPECFVHLENIQLRDTLQRHFDREKKGGCPVRFFDVYESEARRVLAELPLDGKGIAKDDKTSVHVVIVGFGRMGRSVALRASRMGHFANGRKLRISVLDRTASGQGARFLFHYPALENRGDKPGPICDLKFHQGIAESLETRRLVTGWAAEPETLTHVFICIDDNTQALEVAFRLQEALVDRPECALHVRVKKRESLAAIFGEKPEGSVSQPRIIPFGMVEDTCNEEVFTRRKEERVARAIHQRFVEKRRGTSIRTPENDPALREWDDLSDDLRASNFQQADHIAIKMRAIGCEIVDAKDPRLSLQTFARQELELLAPVEHVRWNAERLLAGWRYGASTDKARRINENITEWDSLDDSVKKYDFEAVQDIPVILALASPPLKVVRRRGGTA